jgi:hypothetical protein
MRNFTLKRLKSFKPLFFVFLFFLFVLVKANALFAVTSANPFFQETFLTKCTATSSVSKAAKVCKLERYSCIAQCENNVCQKLIMDTTTYDNPIRIGAIKIFSVLIVKINVSVERRFVFNIHILKNFISLLIC